MVQPSSIKANTKNKFRIDKGWYNAVFVNHSVRSENDKSVSNFGFLLNEKKVIAHLILPNIKSSIPKINSLKKAIGMGLDDVNFQDHYNRHLRVFIDQFDSETAEYIKAESFAELKSKGTDSFQEDTSDAKKEILIVDDQPEIGSLLGNYVYQLGFFPVVVASVSEALTDFDPDKYLMIISDVIMPGQNGFDLVRYIHNNHPEIPVALMSGYFDKEMQNLQKVFGIEKIYRKPVFLNAVKEMIFKALKKMSAKIE